MKNNTDKVKKEKKTDNNEMKKIRLNIDFKKVLNKLKPKKEKVKENKNININDIKQENIENIDNLEGTVANMKKVTVKKKKKKKVKKTNENFKGKRVDKLFILILIVLTALVFGICYLLFGKLIALGMTFLFVVVMAFTQVLDNTARNSKIRKIIKTIVIIGIVFCIVGVVVMVAFFIYIAVKAPEFDLEKFERNETTLIYDNKNELKATLGEEKREKVTYDEIPEVLINAIIATEDSRFFQHNGFDAPRFIKAAIGQILGHDSGGASTLTMQVSKNNLTNSDVSITRKFTDIYLSIFKIEKNLSKQQIIEYYVNNPYLGNYSYGIEQASLSYFNKHAYELNLAEASLIAGLFQAPGDYDPTVNPEYAYERRETVLNLMVRHGYITKEEAEIANNISIESILNANSNSTSIYQGYIDYVVKEAIKKTGLDPYFYPMEIYTNMDTKKQEGVNNVMNEKTYTWPKNKPTLQAGVAAIESTSGKILAIGSARNRKGERVLSYATDINKQIGSTAKPLFDYGPGMEYNNWSTYTIFKDEKYSYTGGGVMQNYDFRYLGDITLRYALSDSRNVPALKAFQQVDNKKIYEFVTSLGIVPETTEGSTYLHEAHSIGSFNGSNPLTMAGAYQAFSNGGYFYEPYSINKIVLRDTGETFNYSSDKTKVMSDSTAYMITDVLKAVAVQTGVRGAINTPIALKTGTTNYDSKTRQEMGYPSSAAPDGWIVGYTPNIVMAMWTGFDTNTKGEYLTSNQMTSHRNALYRALSKAVFDRTGQDFKRPSSVISVTVEKGTNPGLLPSENTPSNMKITELFKRGTEPTDISNAYIPLENVTGLTSSYANGELTLTWNAVNMPTLNKGEDQKFGNFGYKVYADGKLLGFTKDATYSITTDNPYATYVVYTAFEKVDTNRSSGETLTLSPDVTFNYYGNDVTLHIGDTYIEDNLKNIIRVYMEGSDVTSEVTITIKMTDETGEVVDTIDTTKLGTYKVEYLVQYKNASKTFTKNITVLE